MEKLEQVDINCMFALECAKIETCVEKIESEPEKLTQDEYHKKPVKSRLSKLFKKSNLNARYMEQVIPIDRIEHQRIRRDYGIF